MKGKMTVYEMIQELAQYPADQLIEVNVYADGFGVEAETQEEAEEGDYIDAKVCIDEEIQEMSVEEYKKFNGQRVVRINVDLDSSRKEYAGKSRIDKLSCGSGRKRENCYAGWKSGCRREMQSGGC